MQAVANSPIIGAVMLPMRVASVERPVEDVKLFTLQALYGERLPPAEPGAHIDVHLPGGEIRQYSLVDCGDALHQYRIAVKRIKDGRGGSAWLHDTFDVGHEIMMSPPRNNFPLDETGTDYIFIAGGIGITPVLPMIERVEMLGRRWTLHYAVQRHEHALFRKVLSDYGGKVIFYTSRESNPSRLDLHAVLSAAQPDARVYCCGPAPMLQAFRHMTANWPSGRARMEAFEALEESDRSGGFVVELSRSGLSLNIGTGQTILEAILEAGVDVPSSCRDGVCGTCETRVLAGVPDHRDVYLTVEEQDAGDRIMVCCSGCRGDRLVLDL
ncbi:vanillate O-demethylase ferredoxin subunit [Phyllobacterium trifolii]|uniref:Vanillate O-demethylase ferredoxin subunit n=1 Tax=Phyllobacterium trifolii TaxID=300193 RepID=A0A839UEQ0_9HYPH|nr:PDR/VanB family oxidoreductase [Phyllobacterium trifolii]MBB3149608.1 vanillate O-demethylase ferredoxin subunit [Phyllobacterium trifolii]